MMLNNELNDYSKQDPFDEIDETDEIDEPIFRSLILKGTVIFTKIVKSQKFGGLIR